MREATITRNRTEKLLASPAGLLTGGNDGYEALFRDLEKIVQKLRLSLRRMSGCRSHGKRRSPSRRSNRPPNVPAVPPRRVQLQQDGKPRKPRAGPPENGSLFQLWCPRAKDWLPNPTILESILAVNAI